MSKPEQAKPLLTLQVRRPSFDFDGDVPFLWNAELPTLSLLMNALCFMAIAFEQYAVRAMRQALPFLSDPAVASFTCSGSDEFRG